MNKILIILTLSSLLIGGSFANLSAQESGGAAPTDGSGQAYDFTKEGYGEVFIENYPLGPGDELLIRVFTLEPFEERTRITTDGKLILPVLGEMAAASRTIPDIRTELISRYSDYYTDFTLSIDLVDIKKIQVYLYGSVTNPGIYTLFANTTLLEFLQKVGLTTSGRNRRLKHYRGDIETEFDPFRLSVLGEIEKHNIYLQFGDRIEVPIPEVSISISGNIFRPGFYEVLPGESLRDLLELAGGPTPYADMQDAIVERPLPDGTFERLHIDLEKVWDEVEPFETKDRDTVYIPGKDMNIYVLGAVKTAGAYPFVEGKSVEQYLAESGGYDKDAQLAFVTVIRPGPRFGSQVGQKFNVNLKEILKEKFEKSKDRKAFETPRIVLAPGDVIMVPYKGTAEKNANMSLVLTVLQNILQSILIFKGK